MSEKAELLTILGHTAGGKTALAAHVAERLGAEIISADSRQVYRGMNIGSGKDYDDYMVNGKRVPVHLLDIVDAGYEYNVFEFQKDFLRIYKILKASAKPVLLCGGSGLYLESVLRNYELVNVPVNEELRKSLGEKDLDELKKILQEYRPLHNTTDIKSRKRLLRAIEIAEYSKGTMEEAGKSVEEELNSMNFGIVFDREERRSRITLRLKERLKSGMIEEAEALIRAGVTHQKLEYYGLEYKYLSRYLAGSLSYDDMFSQLNTAIHQFAKRQMTYFRGMEKRGIKIHWIDGSLPLEEKRELIVKTYLETT